MVWTRPDSVYSRVGFTAAKEVGHQLPWRFMLHTGQDQAKLVVLSHIRSLVRVPLFTQETGEENKILKLLCYSEVCGVMYC